MSIIVNALNEQEVSNFLERVATEYDYQLIMDRMRERKWVEDFKCSVRDAKDIVIEKDENGVSGTVRWVVILFDGGKTNITVFQMGDEFTYTIHTQFEKDNVKYMKTVPVRDGLFGEHVDMVYEEYIKLAEALKKRGVVVDGKALSWPIYGNWCGPGHSGPDAPIDGIDTCCMYHDKCYGSNCFGYCNCDNSLINCLQPYADWNIASLIIAYFTACKLTCKKTCA